MLVYDAETIINCFLCSYRVGNQYKTFEVSNRRNDLVEFVAWVDDLIDTRREMVGFNTLAFDYPLIYWIWQHASQIRHAGDIYKIAQKVIGGLKAGKVLIPQIDLFKIHHFDNNARRTGLKMLEFNMRMNRVEEMPFNHWEPIADDDIPGAISYNIHDIDATHDFAEESADKIALRRELSEKYSDRFMNYSDSKIGKQIIIAELGKAGIQCYAGNEPRQTHRDDGIPVAQILCDCVQFKSRAFNEILTQFKSLIVRETKGDVKFSCEPLGVPFDFGTGGLHASARKQVFESDDERMIIDADVTSFYPNLSIRHKFYPEHLGEGFLKVYEDIFNTRAVYKKEKKKNLSEAYKLGLNSVYGDSNSEFSPFYDPKMTMSITINGQLFLAMLCERLMMVREFRIIQANTDGCTFVIPRNMRERYDAICAQWQADTKMTLEFKEFKKFWVRDVNAYLAVETDGTLKTKGSYSSKPDWHQNHSFLIVPLAAQAHLVEGKDIEDFVRNHADIYDFMGRVKVNKTDKVLWDGKTFGGVVRYIVTTDGKEMIKEMPALGPVGRYKKLKNVSQQDWENAGDSWDPKVHTKNKSRYEIRRSRINAGQKVTVCNRVEGGYNIDYDFYIREVKKLTEVFNAP